MRLTYRPRPYADLVADHLARHPRAALWAGMGTGKTVLALSHLQALRDVLGVRKPALIVGPKRVVERVWPNEAAKWMHLDYRVVSCSGPRRTLAGDYDALTITYELLPWLAEHAKPDAFGAIVLDEATRVKNFRLRGGGRRAGALARFAARTDHVIELTGTPTPNGLIDLWGQLWFIDGGQRLGRTYTAFLERWFKPSRIIKSRAVSWSPLPHAHDEIMARVSDVCLSIRPEDWLELPETRAVRVDAFLSPEARELYDRVERESLAESIDVTAPSGAARATKLLQMAGGAVYSNTGAVTEIDAGKLEALDSVLEEAEADQVLVAYQYRHELARILRRYKGAVDISTTAGFEQFMAGRARIGCAHPASLGHGVDGLQERTHVIVWYSCWWDYDTHEQMNARVGAVRQAQLGSGKTPVVYYIIAENTLDEVVYDVLVGKRRAQEAVLEYAARKGAAWTS